MRHILKMFGIVILGLTLFTGCTTVPIYNVNNFQTITNKKITSEDVEKAIRLAGAKRGWIIQKVKPGLLIGRLTVRGKHTAIINIPYSNNGYKIEYKNSENLKYNPDNNSIHNKYNKWIIYLENDINANLGIVQSGGKLSNATMDDNAPIVNLNLDGKTVYMRSSINYSKKSKVADNIKAECHIDQQLVDFITQYANQQGINLVVSNNIKKSDIELVVEITEAVSRRAFLTGHNKYTSIAGKLVQGNNELSSFQAARYSGGGAFAVYKDSCSVLGRTVQVLAKKDVAHWLKNPVNGAKLGNTEFITQ
ncbi:hypothetical protein [Arcobacter sp.]|uniref:hypothetical protein n=1 Tax=Arcobacter sp. TaxID=1872629 RepID=UPI003D1394FF